MKKCFIIAMCLCSILAFARSPHRGHHHHRGGDGVWLAAGITGIVANGINILNAVSSPRYVPAPVVTTPVVVPQTVYPQVEYLQPQVVYPQAVGVPPYRYYEQRVPVVQTILVPIQVNGRIVYRQEQRVIYVTK